MLDLTNTNLRLRDLRKVVEPSLCKIEWQKESSTSEWTHIKNGSILENWILKIPVETSEFVLVTDKSWYKSVVHDWEFVRENLLSLKSNGFTLFISQHKLWALEINPVGVARFGFWR